MQVKNNYDTGELEHLESLKALMVGQITSFDSSKLSMEDEAKRI